jgi:ribosomal protein L31
MTNYAGAGTDWDVFYKRWDASTSSWTTTEVVSTESTLQSSVPSLAVDTVGNVHIAWPDLTVYAGSGIDRDIFYKRWDTFASLWTTTEVVSTESTGNSGNPSLAVDATGNVHIAWRDWTDYLSSGTDIDVFYKRWDESSSWTTTEVVSTESTGTSYIPSLAVDTVGYVHIAWHDLTDYAGAGPGEDIFYKRWDFSTYLRTTTEVVSTESSDESLTPSLAVDTAGNVHIAWFDFTDYSGSGWDYDIFYKQFAGPPAVPELAFIAPNPTKLTTIYLDWNNVLRATSYHVYRSTSYIWSIEGLVPITTVSSSDHIDIVPLEGFYYYVVVAENFVGNSSHSNCQYVEVKFADLNAPELAPILPNPTDSDSISLVWDNVEGAVEYHIYRSDAYIWSVEVLTPIATVGSTSYIDSLPSEGYYFYVIVANDGAKNSTHSNCEYVEYKVAHLREFTLVSGLILAAFALVFVVTRIRKKNFKLN